MMVHLYNFSDIIATVVYIGFASLAIFWFSIQFTAWRETGAYGSLLLMLIALVSALMFGVFGLTLGMFRILPREATAYARVALLALFVLWFTYTVYYMRLLLKLRGIEKRYEVTEQVAAEQQERADAIRIQLLEEEKHAQH